MTEGEILVDHPTLRAADLVNAWAYVAAHRQEIEGRFARMRPLRVARIYAEEDFSRAVVEVLRIRMPIVRSARPTRPASGP